MLKDEALQKLLVQLRNVLGNNSFDVVDYWEEDSHAIGLARPDDHEVLVYVSIFGAPKNSYFASLELPPSTKDFPYRQSDEFDHLTFDELLAVIKQHFKTS